MIHPVLNTFAGKGLNGQAPDKSAYKMLNNYHFHSMMLCFWERYFEEAERDAAAAFCKLAVGLPKKEVEKLGGAPCFKGTPPLFCTFAAPLDDLWMYQFGGTCQTVRLIFKNDRCTDAKICTWGEANKFNESRVIQVCDYARGKTETQILKHEGQPTFEQTDSSTDDTNETRSNRNNTKLLTYEFGLSNAAQLTILSGICVKPSV